MHPQKEFLSHRGVHVAADRVVDPPDRGHERLRGDLPLAGIGAAWRQGLFQQRPGRARLCRPGSGRSIRHLPELSRRLPPADV